MPDSTNARKYPHLALIYSDVSNDRRKRPGRPPIPPAVGERSSFAAQLRGRLGTISQATTERNLAPLNIQPHLVFRVPLSIPKAQENVSAVLEQVGLNVVSYEDDGAIIAFREETDLDALLSAIDQYADGPKIKRNGEPNNSTKWDVFEYIDIENMNAWGPADRIGDRLGREIGKAGANIVTDHLYFLDVELWYRGRASAEADIKEIRDLLAHDQHCGERFMDWFVGDTMSLLRVAVTGAKLSLLLTEVDSVAGIELPPVPTFDPLNAITATPRQFSVPKRPLDGGARLCIIDSGIASNHPLLRNHVGHEESILTQQTTPADLNGHGTRVAGVAVFGHVREAYLNDGFQSPITLFSARVLNDQNKFDEQRLIINQMEAAIKTFMAAPYDCRVFNLSLGHGKALIGSGSSRQSEWAEALDLLARRHKVLIVVSAGNHALSAANTPADAKRILNSYPRFLSDDQARLCDPATAAIALTIGAIAETDIPAVRHGANHDDIVRTLAKRHEPSPFTRVGPGINNSIKPEFVDYGGNVAFDGTGSQNRFIRPVDNRLADAGLAVMSFSHKPLTDLFCYDVGTSYAAPRVARIAALLWERLKESLGHEPHPNLVRAVLATAARTLPQANAILGNIGQDPINVCGYGLIDEDLALNSTDQRVTMVAQDSIKLDSIRIF